MRLRTLLYAGLCLVSGCASVSTIPLSANSFQLTTKASPECSADQAQRIALKRAAAETLKQGYDSFIITNAAMQPVVYSGWGGGIGQISNQALSVTMYRNGDPEAAKALSARDVLGPKWQDALKEQTFNCWDA